MHLLESGFFLQRRQQHNQASWNYFEARDEVFYVFKTTNFCFRERVYFPAVKTPLVSWCDGIHRIDEKARLVSFRIMWNVFLECTIEFHGFRF